MRIALLLALSCFMPQAVTGMGLDFGTTDPEPIPVVEPVITSGPLGAPVRVVSFSKDWLLVSDYNSGTIYYVNKTDPNQIRKGFTIKGRVLAVEHSGKNILVGNESTGFIEVYNPRGKLKYRLNETAIKRPSDLAVDQDSRKIFVVDSRAHEIKIYRHKKLLAAIGTDQLVNPVGIALDPEEERIYVSDHGDSMTDIPPSVFAFRYDGTLLEQFIGEEYGFFRPRGLAFDGDKLYVTDALSGEVVIIDTVLKTNPGTVGTYGSDAGQLVQPQDVAVEPGGAVVYVANKRLGRIERITVEEVIQ